MPHYRCCVGACDNDSRYPDKIVKRGHVEGEMRWHYIPKDPKKRAEWSRRISKGLENFVATDNKVVCSNHFRYGKPTFAFPFPTEYLVARDKQKVSSKKRRAITFNDAMPGPSKSKLPNVKEEGVQCTIISPTAYHSLTFAELTREHDARMFTGLSCQEFQCVFSFLQEKAKVMHYWKGPKDAEKDTSQPRVNSKQRALTLEQEFLLCMMKLKMALFLFDLAFRFSVSESTASSVFTTWVKLMSKELKWLISFPDRRIIVRNLPSMFRRYYPKCRVIIDCTELFIETPTSLKIAAMCWSNYKQHYTAKFLIGITPNGFISFVSDTYGGRASDVHIVGDSGFCNYLQPHDQVMADRGFKIHDLLAFYQCSLVIPPSKHSNIQMSASNVKKTSIIANVRIYVEQAIKRVKDFHILKNEIPITLLPLVDDIVVVCSALSNLQKPLSQ